MADKLKVINELYTELSKNRPGTRKEVLKYARRMGYEIKEGRKKTVIREEGEDITYVPRRGSDLGKRVYNEILKDIVNYESKP